jgi:hypothetical protein
VPSQRIADEEAVVEPWKLLSTDLTFFAAARSATVIRMFGTDAIVMFNDLFRDDGGFVEVPVTEVNDLLAGVRVALTYV